MADADPMKITVELDRSLIEGLRVERERGDTTMTRMLEQQIGDRALAACPLDIDPNVEWVIVSALDRMQRPKRAQTFAAMTKGGEWDGWTTQGYPRNAARFPSREAADPLLRQVRRVHKTALAVPVHARKRRTP